MPISNTIRTMFLCFLSLFWKTRPTWFMGAVSKNIIMTKIAFLLNYDIFHLNFRYQIIFVALCQIALGWSVWVTEVRKVGDGKSMMATLALHVESHSRAITVGKHLSLMALVGGTYLLL